MKMRGGAFFGSAKKLPIVGNIMGSNTGISGSNTGMGFNSDTESEPEDSDSENSESDDSDSENSESENSDSEDSDMQMISCDSEIATCAA